MQSRILMKLHRTGGGGWGGGVGFHYELPIQLICKANVRKLSGVKTHLYKRKLTLTPLLYKNIFQGREKILIPIVK